MDLCAGELVAIATGHGGLFDCVWGVRGGRPRPGEEEREREKVRGAAHVSSLIGALGRPWSACEQGQEREKEEGADRMPCCGRRGASAGVRGRAEVAGGGWK